METLRPVRLPSIGIGRNVGVRRKGRVSIPIRASMYERFGDCLLYAAPQVRNNKPKALVQFLGGAFIGAAPEITYSYFIELLAKQGFLIMAAPYNVTFDHEICARRIHRNWCQSLDMISKSGCSSFNLTPQDVLNLPTISIGHSNGALMQVLIGSYCQDEKLPKANAIVSFNNKPAADAVPFFEQLGPSLSSFSTLTQGTPAMLLAEYLTEEAVKVIKEPPFPLPPWIERESLDPVTRFIQQIPAVFGQVADGVSEFRPTPQENRVTIATSYSVPHTLLVKFTVDTIDETDALEELLRPRIDKMQGTLKKLVLNGTHATPLAPDIKVEVGDVYTPADAINQAVRKAALADLNNLSKEITNWFESLKAQAVF